MAEGSRGYAQRVDIRAGIDTVWQALIDPKLLSLWYASAVRIDARQGGIYAVRLRAKHTLEAHIDVFLPPRRLRLIYMPFPGVADEGAVIVDDFLLDRDETSGTTVLRLLGSGIPDGDAWNPIYLRLRKGWDRALLRLKVLLERPRGPAATAAPTDMLQMPAKRLKPPAGS
jgi:uncharacterized protein YndB with AHSA1/START domain